MLPAFGDDAQPFQTKNEAVKYGIKCTYFGRLDRICANFALFFATDIFKISWRFSASSASQWLKLVTDPTSLYFFHSACLFEKHLAAIKDFYETLLFKGFLPLPTRLRCSSWKLWLKISRELPALITQLLSATSPSTIRIHGAFYAQLQ